MLQWKLTYFFPDASGKKRKKKGKKEEKGKQIIWSHTVNVSNQKIQKFQKFLEKIRI